MRPKLQNPVVPKIHLNPPVGLPHERILTVASSSSSIRGTARSTMTIDCCAVHTVVQITLDPTRDPCYPSIPVEFYPPPTISELFKSARPAEVSGAFLLPPVSDEQRKENPHHGFVFSNPKPRTSSLSKPPSNRHRLSQSASKRKIRLPQNWVCFPNPLRPLTHNTKPKFGFVFETLLRPSHLASKRKPPFAHPQAPNWVRF